MLKVIIGFCCLMGGSAAVLGTAPVVSPGEFQAFQSKLNKTRCAPHGTRVMDILQSAWDNWTPQKKVQEMRVLAPLDGEALCEKARSIHQRHHDFARTHTPRDHPIKDEAFLHSIQCRDSKTKKTASALMILQPRLSTWATEGHKRKNIEYLRFIKAQGNQEITEHPKGSNAWKKAKAELERNLCGAVNYLKYHFHTLEDVH